MSATKDPQLNGLIAKIHVAKKQVAMEEESYRAMLMRVTGLDSLRAMNKGALEKVITEFERLGFAKARAKDSGKRKMAAEPQARKIRALWLTLKDMNELRDSSEEALAAFVSKTADVSDLHWITSSQADQVINALRGWIVRVEKRNNPLIECTPLPEVVTVSQYYDEEFKARRHMALEGGSFATATFIIERFPCGVKIVSK